MLTSCAPLLSSRYTTILNTIFVQVSSQLECWPASDPEGHSGGQSGGLCRLPRGRPLLLLLLRPLLVPPGPLQYKAHLGQLLPVHCWGTMLSLMLLLPLGRDKLLLLLDLLIVSLLLLLILLPLLP